VTDKESYGQILKSSSIMGGAAGINMLLGMVRVKFAAVLIGTGGIGLLASFMAIQGLVGTIAGFGLQSSAVRDVVSSAARGDQQAIGRTVLTLRRMCWLTGVLGMVAMMVLSPLLSQWTFGSDEYTLHIALLGATVLLSNLSGGQAALIQGMRRIGDLARMNIISAAVGTIVSIIFYVWLGLQGIMPALVLISVIGLAVSWYFARRVPVPKVEMRWIESFREAKGMLRLGFAFMWSTLIASIVIFATYALITHQINLEAVGIYSAAFALSGMFVNFILGAMGADFYPRLTGLAHDRDAMNRLVNEQTEIGLLLTLPGLLATLSLATWVIHIFYTSEFLPAVDLLQWFALGCIQRVVSWPLGFVLRALGKEKLFIATETIFHGSHLLLIIIGLEIIGLEGAAIAFFLMNTFVTAVIYLVIRNLTGFKWASTNITLMSVIFPVMILAFILVKLMPLWPGTIFGLVLTALSFVLCLRELTSRIGHQHRLLEKVLNVPGMRALLIKKSINRV
jgi:antigen flippase